MPDYQFVDILRKLNSCKISMASIIGTLFRASSLLSMAKTLVTSTNNTRIGDVVIDACLNEVIHYKSSITEHPIENKTALSDHIFKEPLRVKIDGYITDSPIRIFGLIETPLQNNSLASLKNNALSLLPFNSADKPSHTAYLALKSLYEDRCLISLVTKLETFANMAINALSFTNDTDTGNRLSFSADLTQIVFAHVETVAVKDTRLTKVTSPVVNRGNVEKKEIIVEKEKSMLLRMYEGLSR